MPRLAPELIEQIAAANDIVEVIGGYFPLKRVGGAFKALCPFHQERTPSFQVNPHKQIFKCFGCGAGGSVFRFVMDYEHVDFVTAAKKLAARANIQIVEQELSAEDRERVTLRRRLLALHAEAAEFFHFQLMRKPSAVTARDYLKSRGIGGEIAKSWQLGYAPAGGNPLLALARERGFSAEEIAKSGLVSISGDEDEERANPSWSQLYDRFRDRVMFPICSGETGEVIAFSGRVLDAAAHPAKYVNSPETLLFTKGAVLFGLHRSKRALIDKQSAIVCEGQLDLITAFEAGVQNVIAVQGTAFTEKQARILKKYVEEVVMCFDADAAGEKAAVRSLAALLGENLAVRVATMPPGEDPDSLIRGRGAEAFTAQVAGAQDFFDFQLERLMAGPDFDSPRGRMQAARRMAESISLITDAVLRETILNRVTMRLEISAQEFAKMLKAPWKSESLDVGPAQEPMEVETSVANLICVAFKDGPSLDWLRSRSADQLLSDGPDCALLMKILKSNFDLNEPSTVAAFQATLSKVEEITLSQILETGMMPVGEFTKNSSVRDVSKTVVAGRRRWEAVTGDPLRVAHDCWNELERRAIRRRIEAAQARLRAPDQPLEAVLKAQKEVLDLQKRLLDIARPFSPPTWTPESSQATG